MGVMMYACSETGVRHLVNEDGICILSAIISGQVVTMSAVCDGVGGLPGGKQASAYCISRLTGWFCKEFPVLFQKRHPVYSAEKSLRQLFQKMNEDLFQRNEGSTCSVFLLVGRRFLVLHTGDSRIYIFGKRLRCLTKDERIKGSNVLSQCLGMGGTISAQQKKGILLTKGILLIGSDGFFQKISKRELQMELRKRAFLEEMDMEKCCEQFIHLLRHRGEQDDITVGMICFHREGGFARGVD